jgi:hypothetical protein
VVSENVIGLGLGFVFFVKLSAPLVRTLPMYDDPVTIKRDAMADFWTRVEFLYAG